MPETNREKEKIDRAIQLLDQRVDQLQTYHNHKETMAHAALLVALAIAGFVLTSKDWPPEWVPPICISQQWVTFLGLAIIWFMIHWYMRWQLRRRRAAAQLVACLLILTRRWATYPPSIPKIMQATEGNPPPRSPRTWLWKVLDFFVPCENASVEMDAYPQIYPQVVVDTYQKTKTEALCGERIVTLGSLLILGLIAAGTFLRP
ncbi:MAG: hypothetical protein ACREU5_10275 [Burkholderiales bacterium]